MTMQTSSKPRRGKRLFFVLGVLIILILVGLAGGYIALTRPAAHQASAKQPSVSHQQQPNSPAPGLNQTPGAQTTGSTQQDGTTPDVTHFVQSLLTPGSNLSGGGCLSYHTSAYNYTFITSSQPTMYGREGGDAPTLGLSFNYCNGTIQVRVHPSIQNDYLRIDWWRPGRNGWSQYTTTHTSSVISNAHFDTRYEVTVSSCVSHWYGDSCSDWSPYVYISTKP